MADIVKAIRDASSDRKISLAEIARILGMSQQSFSQMLKSESIKFSVVEKVADVLNMTIPELLGEVRDVSSTVSTESRLLSIIESQQRTIENLTKK